MLGSRAVKSRSISFPPLPRCWLHACVLVALTESARRPCTCSAGGAATKGGKASVGLFSSPVPVMAIPGSRRADADPRSQSPVADAARWYMRPGCCSSRSVIWSWRTAATPGTFPLHPPLEPRCRPVRRASQPSPPDPRRPPRGHFASVAVTSSAQLLACRPRPGVLMPCFRDR